MQPTPLIDDKKQNPTLLCLLVSQLLNHCSKTPELSALLRRRFAMRGRCALAHRAPTWSSSVFERNRLRSSILPAFGVGGHTTSARFSFCNRGAGGTPGVESSAESILVEYINVSQPAIALGVSAPYPTTKPGSTARPVKSI